MSWKSREWDLEHEHWKTIFISLVIAFMFLGFFAGARITGYQIGEPSKTCESRMAERSACYKGCDFYHEWTNSTDETEEKYHGCLERCYGWFLIEDIDGFGDCR